MRYLLEQSDETLATHSGLALVGLMLNRTPPKQRLSQMLLPDRAAPHISNYDVAVSYIGLLCQGKGDFDHIEQFREDPFFRQSLMLGSVPSSPTLRQRLDIGGRTGWSNVILKESVNLFPSDRYFLSTNHLPRFVARVPALRSKKR